MQLRKASTSSQAFDGPRALPLRATISLQKSEGGVIRRGHSNGQEGRASLTPIAFIRSYPAADNRIIGSTKSEFRMPRTKVLKGVAHNVGSSFTSLMNYSADDYSLGHILRFARQSGLNTLEIDLLSGQGSPATLLEEPLSALPEWYSKMFLRLVQSAGSDKDFIQSATLTLSYDLQRTRPSPIPGEPQSPYTCDVSIRDTRGRDYAAHFDGWWFIERMELNRPRKSSACTWWNPITWLRSRWTK